MKNQQGQQNQNILDNVIIFASLEQELKERVEAVLQRIQEYGLALKKEKDCLNMPKVEFMGHVRSENGITPEKAEIKAVASARELKCACEGRSFLRLVNYCGGFVSDMATITEPLRQLTRRGAVFTKTEAQEQSCETLKQKLCDATVLGYVDKTCKTQIIADASPTD